MNSIKSFLFILALVLVSVSARADMPDFTKLVEKHAPAVVNISTTKKVQRSATGPQFTPEQLEQLGPFADLFRFRGAPNQMQPAPSNQRHSLGSGFIISEDGYVVTNHHVVEGADEVIVRMNDRRELTAKIIGSDKRSDIALLKIEGTNLPYVNLGRSEDVKVGEWVLAIGSPFGFDASVTSGIVSAKGRALPDENYVPFIQTDVAINPGNSGGPLFNLNGEVIGVNSQIYSRTGGFMGLSFAIPIDDALNVVDQLKSTGTVTRGWLGVTIQEVSRDLAESFGLDKPQGALIAGVVDDSPADKSGLKVGDVIVKFNGKRVIRSSALPPMVGRVKVGEKVPVTVYREGKRRNLSVQVGALDAQVSAVESDKTNSDNGSRLGLSIREPEDSERQQLSVAEGGVIVTALSSGVALDSGINRGDIITHVNNRKIRSVAQFKSLIASLPSGKVVPFLIARSYGREFIAVRIP